MALSKIFERLFRPSSIPRPFIIVTPLLVALIVALVCQYVVILPVKGISAVPYLILTGLIIGVPLTYKFRARKFRGIGLGAAVVIGFFLVPYFAFFFGRINIYMTDALAPGVKLVELRPTIGRVALIDNAGSEVTVLPGPITLYLYPGGQRVYLGT